MESYYLMVQGQENEAGDTDKDNWEHLDDVSEALMRVTALQREKGETEHSYHDLSFAFPEERKALEEYRFLINPWERGEWNVTGVLFFNVLEDREHDVWNVAVLVQLSDGKEDDPEDIDDEGE